MQYVGLLRTLNKEETEASDASSRTGEDRGLRRQDGELLRQGKLGYRF